MKKIIIGTLILTLSPFIVIGGAAILNSVKLQEGAFNFASILGGLSICINYFIAILLIIQGHKEQGTLKDLG